MSIHILGGRGGVALQLVDGHGKQREGEKILKFAWKLLRKALALFRLFT